MPFKIETTTATDAAHDDSRPTVIPQLASGTHGPSYLGDGDLDGLVVGPRVLGNGNGLEAALPDAPLLPVLDVRIPAV